MKAAILDYDFTTQEAREKTASDLFNQSKIWRSSVEMEWEKWDDYYNFIHDASDDFREYCKENGLPIPPVLPDPYIQVESQICPDVPEPEFRGRDDDLDSKKAKQREFAVKYVLDNNRVKDMNTSNERRLVKLGDAYWKAYWDKDMRCGLNEGDIHVKDIPVENIYPDPSCGADDIQSGQYVALVYNMHKVQFAQVFAADLKRLRLTADELINQDYQVDGRFDKYSGMESYKDCVQILEFWYKQPVEYYDTKLKMTVPAGAVACTIQVGDHELRNIPLYWKNTFRQCQLFPFVHYWRIRDETQFFNKSEIFAIKEMVDAGDRKFGNSILNDSMMSNDIILEEENAFADGYEPSNAPGARWKLKQNKVNSVRRLGGLQSAAASDAVTNFISEQIQRTNRNYDTNQGREAARTTTASGLAMLRDDAESQANIKKNDRLLGFERLFELIDWLCLEFFDKDRLLFIGAKNKDEEGQSITYNSSNFAVEQPAIYDETTLERVRDPWTYYPKVDVNVNAGDGIMHGPQATASALEKLAALNITAQNYKIIEAELDILDLPQKKELKDMWDKMFAPAISPEITQALEQNPHLLQTVEQFVMMNQGGMTDAVPEM